MARMSLEQQPDGRHAVMNEQGQVVGLHNSLKSAQRQLEDYYTPQPEAPGSAGSGAAAAPAAQLPNAAPLQQAQAALMAHQVGAAQVPAPVVAPGQVMSPMAALADHLMSQPGHPAAPYMPQAASAQQAVANHLAGLKAGQDFAAQALASRAAAPAAAPGWGGALQHANNVDLVNRLSGPNGPAATPAAQLQAFTAFHPGARAAGAYGAR